LIVVFQSAIDTAADASHARKLSTMTIIKVNVRCVVNSPGGIRDRRSVDSQSVGREADVIDWGIRASWSRD